MSWRVRRRTRRLAGVVPEQKLERRLWLAWVPMVVLWMALPMVAMHGHGAPFGVPAWAREGAYANVRGLGGIVAIFALVATIECWKRMGRSWRMAVTPGEKTELVTTGPLPHRSATRSTRCRSCCRPRPRSCCRPGR